jgi:1-acyl-sn-glycerol-3-phosphate acyltransferase
MDLVQLGAGALRAVDLMSQRMGQALTDAQITERMEQLRVNLGPYGIDPFGFDPQYVRHLVGPLSWLYRYYFRCQVSGMQHVPDGRALFVANHSGQLPYDGAMICTALFLDREPPLFVRSMVERFVPATPFLSPALARCGQVLGTPENCRRLLQADQSILIFPEGVAGLNKTWQHRYRLQHAGNGFMRLAIEQQVPIVPVAVIGAEEQAPSLWNMRALGRALGLPALPLTPAPLFGLIPLPTRYRLHFGEPMRFAGHANDEDEVIRSKVDQVMHCLQGMLDNGVASRAHVFW